MRLGLIAKLFLSLMLIAFCCLQLQLLGSQPSKPAGALRQVVEEGLSRSDSGQTTTSREILSNIVLACYTYLLKHECIGARWGLPFHFYRPSLEKYSGHQWLWDSGAHMIVWSHKDVNNSIQDLRTMLHFQQANGMVPEMVFWSAGKLSWFRRKLDTMFYSNEKHTDITQMPNLPFSVRAMYTATGDISLLREFVPPLVDYFDWWRRTRDVAGNGLVAIIHGWESGIDASPAYDHAYGIYDPYVSYFDVYPRLLKLLISYKISYGWNVTEILARQQAPTSLLDNWFVVFDVGVNSVYASGWGVLADLASHFNATLSSYCKEQQARSEQAILEHCWSADLQRFVSMYKDRDGVIRHSVVETAQSLFPLLLESLPHDKQESIVKTQLLNPSKFWVSYPIPSTSRDAPQYEPKESRLLWRGPTWPILTWFVMEGLTRHGFTTERDMLLDRWVALYEQSGVWEQYNPETGEGFGAVGLGMSTLIVDWLFRTGRVNSTIFETPGIGQLNGEGPTAMWR